MAVLCDSEASARWDQAGLSQLTIWLPLTSSFLLEYSLIPEVL